MKKILYVLGIIIFVSCLNLSAKIVQYKITENIIVGISDTPAPNDRFKLADWLAKQKLTLADWLAKEQAEWTEFEKSLGGKNFCWTYIYGGTFGTIEEYHGRIYFIVSQ